MVYLTNTPPLCFLGYSFIESGLPLVYKLYGLYWIVWFIMQLGVVSTMAIKVNTQVCYFRLLTVLVRLYVLIIVRMTIIVGGVS